MLWGNKPLPEPMLTQFYISNSVLIGYIFVIIVQHAVSIKIKSCHNANYVILGGMIGCHNDSMKTQCCQWWQIQWLAVGLHSSPIVRFWWPKHARLMEILIGYFNMYMIGCIVPGCSNGLSLTLWVQRLQCVGRIRSMPCLLIWNYSTYISLF